MSFLFVAVCPLAADAPSDSGSAPETFLAAAEKIAADETAKTAKPPAKKNEPAKEPPPLPFHSIEGYSGGPITPMAYICNTGPEGSIFGKPVVSYTFLNMGSKTLHTFAVTQSFFGRVELGYAFNRLSLGSLRQDLRNAGLNPGCHEVWLHHFNIRVLMLKENSFDLPLPAVTGGVHFKYNDGVKRINRNLGGALETIGYDKDTGVDFTLTATKMFPTLAFGRPVILTVGLRLSQGHQIGLLGFGDAYRPTVETSVVYLPTDWLALAYEFRQKRNPYNKISGLIGDEDSWHAFSASWIVNENLTVTAVYGMFGTVLNAEADCNLGIQVKWEL